jgi:hypothetical protein
MICSPKRPFIVKTIAHLLPLAALLLHTATAFGQDAGYRFSLGLGLDAVARQDQIFSPFVHQGASPVHASLSWERSGPTAHLLELRFNSLSADRGPSFDYYRIPEPERFSTYPNYFTLVELNYGLAKTVQAGRATFRLGGMLENNVQAMNYSYGPFSFFGYFAAFGAGPWASLSLPAGRNGAFDAGLQFPLIAWTARSPYLANDDEFIENTASHNGFGTFVNFVADGSLHFPDRFQKLTASARYRRTAGKRWEVGLAYRLQFIRQADPLSLISWQHHFGIQISRKSTRNS